MARDSAVVLDSQDQNATLGVGKGGHIFCHLIAHTPSLPGARSLISLHKEGLTLEMLPFILPDEGFDVEAIRRHGRCEAEGFLKT